MTFLRRITRTRLVQGIWRQRDLPLIGWAVRQLGRLVRMAEAGSARWNPSYLTHDKRQYEILADFEARHTRPVQQPAPASDLTNPPKRTAAPHKTQAAWLKGGRAAKGEPAE